MKNNQLLIALILPLLLVLSASAQRKAVVLGSSTAAGTGASTYDSSWVGRLQLDFRKNIIAGNPDTVVTNLAVGGYVTYQIMPTGYTPPPGKPSPDPDHNVTKALSFLPEVIIINLPTNDIGTGYSETEFMNNLRFLYQHINSAGVKAYITTTQPRSQFAFQQRQMLRELVDSINNNFASYAINFWDDLATNDGQYLIKPEVNSGDGVHVNNLGHRLLFERVKTKNIFGSAPSPAPLPAIKLEAENWSSMSGVQTETVYDAGGGLNVGWIDQGDWMDYVINTSSSGSYTVNLRIATPNNGAQLQIKKSDGTVLSTVNLVNTGAYQNWQTVSTSITLAQGVQTIRVQSSANPGWNINWLELSGGGSPANQPPTASAGSNQTITLPISSVTLNGSGSDVDGFISSYSWTRLSGPTGSTISSPSSASTNVTGLVQGIYVFRLMVTDNQGATASGDVTITVNGSGPPPTSSIKIEAENWSSMSGVQTETVYDAGGGLNVGWIDQGDWMDYVINTSSSGSYTVNLRIATPNNGAQLQIKKSDGTVLSTVNLVNTGAYQNWQTVSTSITLAQGVQTIRVQSSANPGWNINWLELSGGGSPANQPPTASAGSNQTITLPISSVTLNGSGSDVDGFISSYSWTRLSGPTGSTISSPSSASTNVTGLVQGIYVFRLMVTDNQGATASGDVTITVNGSGPPPTSSIKIEAENWSSMSGVQTETVYDAGGGLNVGWIDQGDWMDYVINTSSSGSYTVNLRIATPNNGAQLQIKKSDGTVLSTVNLVNTGAYQNWQTVSTSITLAQGVQTIRVQSSASAFWNINWFQLVSAGVTVTGRGGTSEQSRESSLTIFPNPVKDRFTLSLYSGYSGNLKVQIINMQGIILKQFSLNKMRGINQMTLPVYDLPKGEYILMVEMNSGKEIKKLTKL